MIYGEINSAMYFQREHLAQDHHAISNSTDRYKVKKINNNHSSSGNLT
jgi:hypothetical protein